MTLRDLRRRIKQALHESAEPSFPTCFDCGTELDFDDSNNRDTETMGGLGVEYLKCPKCQAEYSKVEGSDDVCQEKEGNPMSETQEPEAFYRDAQDRESDAAQVRKELEIIKQAGLEREHEALMKGIFALPIQEFDRRAAALQQLQRKAEKIVAGRGNALTRSTLKEIIKHTLRTILSEMNRARRIPLSMLDEAISHEDLTSAWREDQSGEYVQINPDDSVWYVAHGRAREQIAPKGTGDEKFAIIKQWMTKNHIMFNIWGVNDHGNVELYNRAGQALGGLAEQLYEMTTTGAIAPINLPGNVKGGWVASKGGSARGVAGSKSLGYELTSIGKKDMARKQDPVYE